MPRSGKNTGHPTPQAYFNSDSRPDFALRDPQSQAFKYKGKSQIPKKPSGGSSEANNTLRERHNSSHHWEADFNIFYFFTSK